MPPRVVASLFPDETHARRAIAAMLGAATGGGRLEIKPAPGGGSLVSLALQAR